MSATLGLLRLAKLPELGSWIFRDTRVTDAGMPALANLQHLDIGCSSSTRRSRTRAWPSWKACRVCSKLTLKGSKVTDKGKARLLEMYPALKID